MEDFGREVRRLRKEKMLTQKDLAIYLNVDPTYVSKIENNTFEVLPSEEVITKLAECLDVDPEELLVLARKVDGKMLQEKAAEDPNAAYILRRIQKGLSKDELEKVARGIKDAD
jgi:transcriptional regulator with XRE-family HTH domain